MVIGAKLRVTGLTVPRNIEGATKFRGLLKTANPSGLGDYQRAEWTSAVRNMGVVVRADMGTLDMRFTFELRASDLADIPNSQRMIGAASFVDAKESLVEIYSPDLFSAIQEKLVANEGLKAAVLGRQVKLDPVVLTNLAFALTEPNVFFHTEIHHPIGGRLTSDAWNTARGGLYPTSQRLQMHPLATALNYGQGIFEGMVIIKREDGTLWAINPEYNATRFQSSAERVKLTPYPTKLYMRAFRALAIANKDYVPDLDKGRMYGRPLQFGSGAGIGVAPSTAETVVMYAIPVGNGYYKPGEGVNLWGFEAFTRVAEEHKGTGEYKVGGNYGGGIYVSSQAKSKKLNPNDPNSKHYDDALYIRRGRDGKLRLEEAGTSNIFVVCRENGEIVLRTPPSDGSTLKGSTRNIFIKEGERLGIKVIYNQGLTVDHVQKYGIAAFSTGTAVTATKISRLTIEELDGNTIDIYLNKDDQGAEAFNRVKDHVVGIHRGTVADVNHFMWQVA